MCVSRLGLFFSVISVMASVMEVYLVSRYTNAKYGFVGVLVGFGNSL